MSSQSESSQSTKIVVFIAALLCTSFPNGGNDLVLEVIATNEFHLGATVLSCAWLSLMSVGLLWLLRRMTEQAVRGTGWLLLCLAASFGALALFVGILYSLLALEMCHSTPVLIFSLIWIALTVRAAMEMIRARQTIDAPEGESLET